MTIPLYSVDAHQVTPRQAAEWFARDHWPEPRQIDPDSWRTISKDGLTCTFHLIEGVRVYRVAFVPGDGITTRLPGTFEIA